MAPKRSNVEQQAGRSWRAIYAAPILGFVILMVRAFGMAGPTVPFVAEMLEKGRFESDGISVPILKTFFGVPLLDMLFSNISLSFVQLQSKVDPALYYQSLILLTEYAGVYAILLFESSRTINRSTFFQFPSLMAFVAQLAGGGTISSLYLYLFYVFRPVKRLEVATKWRLDGPLCIAVLPSIVIAYYVPHFLSYFHQSLEARHWWNWVWQPYPIWGSMAIVLFSGASKLSQKLCQWLNAASHSLRIVRITLGIIAVVNTLVYWYTLISSDSSISDIILPRYLIQNPEGFGEILRTIIQYDHICCLGGGILWVAYSFGDLKAAGICHTSWLQLILVSVAVTPVFGVGNLLLLGWLAREELLTSWAMNDGRKHE